MARQHRNRVRMTLFNRAKSNKQIESQQNKIVHLEEELTFQHRKHKDTLGFLKKELSLQECNFYLKYEKVTLNHKNSLIENEAIFHKSLMNMVQERDILRQTIFSLESETRLLKKENEYLKLDNKSFSSSEEFLPSSSQEYLPSSSQEFLPSSSQEFHPSSSQRPSTRRAGRPDSRTDLDSGPKPSTRKTRRPAPTMPEPPDCALS